jgi:hypothetical protein
MELGAMHNMIDPSRIATRGLLAATLLAGTCALANAQSITAAPAGSVGGAALAGVVDVTELAASQANLEELQRPPHEQPVHRLPDGGLTSAPSRKTLDALPLAEPNVGVLGGSGPGFSSVHGFVGLFGGEDAPVTGSETEPPDQGLAVNNNVAAEHINLMIRFFNATTGAPMTGPIADFRFFLVPAFNVLGDTQVFFDPTTHRWFFDVIDVSTSEFDVAMSQTSNPLGKYFVYHISDISSGVLGCGGVNCFPDYPKAGYDANGFYITANLFSNVSGLFIESAIYALPKSKLESGSFTPYRRFDDPSDFVVQPSVPAPGEPFSTAANGSEFLMSAPSPPNLAVLALINTKNIVTGIGSLKLLRSTVAGETRTGTTVPSTQPNVIGPFCKAVGATSAPSLDGGYSGFQATIRRQSLRSACVRCEGHPRVSSRQYCLVRGPADTDLFRGVGENRSSGLRHTGQRLQDLLPCVRVEQDRDRRDGDDHHQ